ncbi:hypothetical protein Hamer_G000860 [Homarus americanus]|uniref:Uncharacterized protein n=1 Tax=Homarus americanus TaxID=6706 RepID=A0A8J5N2H0_HOMAM|nr:hypothetical protein Hamer_G000860 [Homarus americanus]
MNANISSHFQFDDGVHRQYNYRSLVAVHRLELFFCDPLNIRVPQELC